jgi:exopolysaccharide biosynthesis polyprenyl glycosylphosphotransferase
MSTAYQHVQERPIAAGVLQETPRGAQAGSDALRAVAHLFVIFAVISLLAALAAPTWAHGLAGIVVASTIWTASLRLVYRSRWLAPRSLGPVTSTAVGTIAGLAVISTLGFWLPSLVPMGGELVLLSVAVFAVSLLYGRLMRGYFRRRRVLVVGDERPAATVAWELEDDADSEFECVGIVRSPESEPDPSPLEIDGEGKGLTGMIALAKPDILVLANSDEDPEPIFDAVAWNEHSVGAVDLPHFYEHAFGRVPISCVSPRWFLGLIHLNQRAYPRVVKRVFDIVAASVLLLLTAPLLPVIAVFVHRSGPGGIFFRQTRLGEGGRTFEIVKFRTMVDGAEAGGEAVWALEDDPRVTNVGRFLRRTRLDEIPQLWNVLGGDMSIVGPRPERPEFLDVLNAEVPYWTRRHFVKPGITGWAQVRRGYADDVDGTADKLAYDLYYLKHRSLVLDLAILLMTVRILVTGSGAR